MSYEMKTRGQGRLAEFDQGLREMLPTLSAIVPDKALAKRMLRFALNCVVNSPKLQACSKESLMLCVMQASELGLELASQRGHAFMVPYGGEAQLQIGYQGFIYLAYQGGGVRKIEHEVVREGDAFDYERGLNPVLRHVPKLSQRGRPVIGAYAIGTLANGEKVFRVIGEEDIASAKKRGRCNAWKDRPDSGAYAEMVAKTAIRRLYKVLPQTDRMAKAVAYDDGDPAPADALFPELPPITSPDGEPWGAEATLAVITEASEPKPAAKASELSDSESGLLDRVNELVPLLSAEGQKAASAELEAALLCDGPARTVALSGIIDKAEEALA